MVAVPNSNAANYSPKEGVCNSDLWRALTHCAVPEHPHRFGVWSYSSGLTGGHWSAMAGLKKPVTLGAGAPRHRGARWRVAVTLTRSHSAHSDGHASQNARRHRFPVTAPLKFPSPTRVSHRLERRRLSVPRNPKPPARRGVYSNGPKAALNPRRTVKNSSPDDRQLRQHRPGALLTPRLVILSHGTATSGVRGAPGDPNRQATAGTARRPRRARPTGA